MQDGFTCNVFCSVLEATLTASKRLRRGIMQTLRKRYIGQDMQLLHRFWPPPLKQTPHARAFSVCTGRSIPAQRGTIPIVRQTTRKNTYPVHRCRPCLSRNACPRSCGCGTSIAACQLSGQQGGSRMPASEEQSELDR